MDSELEELESLISEHFGRTPVPTPAASQDDDDYGAFDQESDDDEIDVDASDATHLLEDNRARLYFEQVNDSDDGRVDGESDSDEECAFDNDDTDRQKVCKFIKDGCGCNRKCNCVLTVSQIYEHILNVREMTKEEKDMYILGVIIGDSNIEKTKKGKKRQRCRTSFNLFGRVVCRKTFMLAFDIGRYALMNLVTHCNENGATPRKHGNKGKKPKHALRFEDVERVVQFICNYAEEFGIPQPAAPRGRDDIPPIYLTSETTKNMVHTHYVRSCEVAQSRSVKRTTFTGIWHTCLGHIKIASPKDDVCATCEKLRKAILDAVSEEEKLISTGKMTEHVTSAQSERSVYNNCVRLAKETNGQDSDNRYNHYTFDFSQNVCIPHHARQMGPLYFATLRKIQIFGFRVDGMPKQYNFLIDENETMGVDGSQSHGPNAVISMVDWALSQCGDGERSCALHADNCPGQNKNKFVMGYLMWRVMTGQHEKIEYLMQVPGHARCLVDSGFGHIKKLYRRSDCETVDHIQRIVDMSSSTNTAARYPTWQWRDWKSFLSTFFKAVPSIRKYQYFRMAAQEPGILIMRERANEPEVRISILKDPGYRFLDDTRPATVAAPGLSVQRQQYLYRTVRKYLRPQYQDVTCPEPLV